MALAQHHGCPTRLLDWTSSPNVALHFATCNKDHANDPGVIWCVRRKETIQLLPEDARTILAGKRENIFSLENLAVWVKSVEAFDSQARGMLIWLEPPSLDARIVNQYSFFSALGSLDHPIDWWVDQHPTFVRKIIIPPDLKGPVRDRLDVLNVTERVLFPGLDGTSAWLSRYYSDTSPASAQQEVSAVAI
jgi:hypothetical protein